MDDNAPPLLVAVVEELPPFDQENMLDYGILVEMTMTVLLGWQRNEKTLTKKNDNGDDDVDGDVEKKPKKAKGPTFTSWICTQIHPQIRPWIQIRLQIRPYMESALLELESDFWW